MLQQLSGLDTMFLYLESTRTPLEVASLQIYDPSTAPGGTVRFKELLALFESRLDRSRVFRRKLLEVPLSLDHPYWIEDTEFDIEYHVRHIALPRPGDWRQLMIQVSRLQSQHLDKTRPLWEVYVIEGLNNVENVPGGCFALFIKMHHATVDGVSSQEVQRAIHDPEPLKPDLQKRRQPPRSTGASAPSGWALLAKSPLNNALKSLRLMKGVAGALPGLVRAGISSRASDNPPPPRTIFNVGRASANRVIDGRFFEMAEIEKIAKQVPGAKINDVLLAVVGGALRDYLQSKNRLPGRSLIAACPIDIRGGGDEQRANMVSMMTAPIHTEIGDSCERLRAVHHGTLEAKDLTRRIGADTLAMLPMNLPAPVAKNLYPPVMELLTRSGKLSFNTFVTNVPGPPEPIFLAGAQMVRMMGMGPVIDQAGIFHAAFSYAGTLSVSFTACREMLPDPAFYAECIQNSYDKLRDATLRAGRARRPGRKAGAGAGKRGGAKAKKKPTPRRKTLRKKVRKARKAGSASTGRQAGQGMPSAADSTRSTGRKKEKSARNAPQKNGKKKPKKVFKKKALKKTARKRAAGAGKAVRADGGS